MGLKEKFLLIHFFQHILDNLKVGLSFYSFANLKAKSSESWNYLNISRTFLIEPRQNCISISEVLSSLMNSKNLKRDKHKLWFDILLFWKQSKKLLLLLLNERQIFWIYFILLNQLFKVRIFSKQFVMLYQSLRFVFCIRFRIKSHRTHISQSKRNIITNSK
jgi:hypothetical protein